MTLQVWDIGGQTLGGKMLDKYVYGSQVGFGWQENVDVTQVSNNLLKLHLNFRFRLISHKNGTISPKKLTC